MDEVRVKCSPFEYVVVRLYYSLCVRLCKCKHHVIQHQFLSFSLSLSFIRSSALFSSSLLSFFIYKVKEKLIFPANCFVFFWFVFSLNCSLFPFSLLFLVLCAFCIRFFVQISSAKRKRMVYCLRFKESSLYLPLTGGSNRLS